MKQQNQQDGVPQLLISVMILLNSVTNSEVESTEVVDEIEVREAAPTSLT